MLINSRVKLKKTPLGTKKYYGHYINDVGTIVGKVKDGKNIYPIVYVRDRKSESEYFPNVVWGKGTEWEYVSTIKKIQPTILSIIDGGINTVGIDYDIVNGGEDTEGITYDLISAGQNVI